MNVQATEPERLYTSREVARMAQVSLRQLQWWDERKVVTPRHEGHRRLYTPGQVLEVMVIAQLRRKGFSLQKIRKVLRVLHREMGRRLGELLDSKSEWHLLTEGRSIYLVDDQARVIDLLKNARQPMFLICLSEQARRLELVARKPPQAERRQKRLRVAV